MFFPSLFNEIGVYYIDIARFSLLLFLQEKEIRNRIEGRKSLRLKLEVFFSNWILFVGLFICSEAVMLDCL